MAPRKGNVVKMRVMTTPKRLITQLEVGRSHFWIENFGIRNCEEDYAECDFARNFPLDGGLGRKIVRLC